MTDGLHARRKSRTRDALCDAAVQIVATDGVDGLTADRIASVAGVSRRTLFNHFERVEDVLTASVEDLIVDTIDAVIERPSDEPLRTSLCLVLEGLVHTPGFTQVRELERAAERSPATRRYLLEFEDRQASAIEEGLRRRIGPDADPLYVASLAAAACAVLGRVTRLVVAESDEPRPASEPETSAQHIAAIRRAFDLLFDGFDEAAATTLPSSPTSHPRQES